MRFPTVPIGAAFEIYNGATPLSNESRFWDGDIPWITPVDLGKLKSNKITHGERFITQDGYTSCGTQLVREGSIVLSIRAPIGHIAIAGNPLCFNQGCRGLTPRSNLHPKYAYWVLVAAKPALEAAGQGTTFIELSRGKLKTVRISFPDFKIQNQIANFLDEEINKIDELIVKKEKFLLLIQEKNQSLANSIVNGSILGSSEPCYVNWFGTIPKNWLVKRAKFLFREAQERSENGEEELLTVSHITGVTRRSDKNVNMFMAESMEGYKLVSKSDIVINTMWAWMGAIGVSPYNGMISPSYNIYKPITNDYEDDYLDLLLRSKFFVAEATRRSKGIHSSRLRLYPDAFLDILFPIPDKNIQKKILDKFKSDTGRERKIAELSQKSIEKLKEFRTSLITATVTGQLEIKKWKLRGNTDRVLDEDQTVNKRAKA